MKKNTRNLLLSALFAASLMVPACSPENSGNSNSATSGSVTATPSATVNSPAPGDLSAKLEAVGVSNVKNQKESKSNVGYMVGEIEKYKKAYKTDPAKANDDFNAVLKTFGDSDVKDNLLEIKDVAFSEVAQTSPGNNVDPEQERKELEKMIADKFAPLNTQLNDINQKLDKNDSSKIAIGILAQTVLLGLLIAGGIGLLFFQLRKPKTIDAEPSSNPGTPDGAANSTATDGVSYVAGAVNEWQRTPTVYLPNQGKQDAEKSAEKSAATADLSKIENLLGNLTDSVGRLSQKIADSENSISQKLENYRSKVSEPPPTIYNADAFVQKERFVPSMFTPTLVKELKEKYHGRSRPLEKAQFSDLLIPSYRDETFLLTENKSGSRVSYQIIPTKERFRRSEDFFNIQAYFDCDNAGAGELMVEKPALVEVEGDGWKLLDKGRISIQ